MRRQSLIGICVSIMGLAVVPAEAATLMLPTAEEAKAFAQSDKELISAYERADFDCKNRSSDLKMFTACARRDILSEALSHRGYCRNKECQPGQLKAWYRCDGYFSIK